MRDDPSSSGGRLLPLTLAATLAVACVDTNLSDELNWRPGLAPDASPVVDGGPPGGPADGAGGPLDGGWAPSEEGSPPDTTAPWIVAGGACAVTEVLLGDLCVSTGPRSVAVRLWASEPVVAVVRLEPEGVVARSDSPATEHHLLLAPLSAESELSLTAEIEDHAGLTASAGPVEVRTDPPMPTVVVNEVLFDPLGDEPHQELAELHNHGADPVLVDGWTLADEGGEDLLVAPSPIPAGGYALVVSDRYVPGAGGDPAPAAGAMVIRLDGPIGSAGLRNSGEVLTLRDSEGAVVSSYPALTSPPGAGISVERVEPLGPDGDPWNWQPNPAGRATPGGPNAAADGAPTG